MKDPKRFLKYFLYASLVLIGVVIGIAIRHYYHMPIEETINIVDLATLVTTIFLAVYIPEVLDQRSEVKKDKKELMEKKDRRITGPLPAHQPPYPGRRTGQPA
ncbi:MAG: hypothetical protein LIP01_10130 [Tannerellaceae bacterium]|nr:hypothetical protein [Tannerellaceae bacterium]